MGARGRALVSLYLDSIKTILYVRRIVSACFSQCTAVPASEGLAACQALARGYMKVAETWLWVGGVHEARQRLKTSDIWSFCSLETTTTTTSVSFSYLNLPCLPQFQEHSFFSPPSQTFPWTQGEDLKAEICLMSQMPGILDLRCCHDIIIIWTTLRYLRQKRPKLNCKWQQRRSEVINCFAETTFC